MQKTKSRKCFPKHYYSAVIIFRVVRDKRPLRTDGVHYPSKIRLLNMSLQNCSTIDIITIKPVPKSRVLCIIINSPDIPKKLGLLTLKIFCVSSTRRRRALYRGRRSFRKHNGCDRNRISRLPIRFLNIEGKACCREMPEISGFQ